MNDTSSMHYQGMNDGGMRQWMVPAIVVGAAIGITYAATRRRRPSRWDVARRVGSQVAQNREALAESGRDIFARIQVIYEESRKVLEEAADWWARGRKAVRAA